MHQFDTFFKFLDDGLLRTKEVLFYSCRILHHISLHICPIFTQLCHSLLMKAVYFSPSETQYLCQTVKHRLNVSIFSFIRTKYLYICGNYTHIWQFGRQHNPVPTVLIICQIFILQQPFDYFGSSTLFIYLFYQHFPTAVKESITVDK